MIAMMRSQKMAGLKRRIGNEGEEETGKGELGIWYFDIFDLVGVFIT